MDNLSSIKSIEKIELTNTNMENLQIYSQVLYKSPNKIINEALEQYFNNLHKKQIGENNDSNLDYNEFWDGVEL